MIDSLFIYMFCTSCVRKNVFVFICKGDRTISDTQRTWGTESDVKFWLDQEIVDLSRIPLALPMQSR